MSSARRYVAEKLHHVVTDAVAEIDTTSAEAVLAAAGTISSIIEDARGRAERIHAVVSDAEDGTEPLEARLRVTNQAVAGYLEDHAAEADALHADVEEALALARRIVRATEGMSDLVLGADLLGMYVRMEVARLSGSDRHVASIAGQLRELGAEVGAVITSVQAATDGVLGSLPEVLRELAQLARESRALRLTLAIHLTRVEQIAAAVEGLRREALSVSAQRTDALLSRSQTALSRLQFQDPMIQRLREVDGYVARFRTALDGEPIAALRYPDNLGTQFGAETNTPDAGEVTLF